MTDPFGRGDPGFSLEEIIAEVKTDWSAEHPPAGAAVSQKQQEEPESPAAEPVPDMPDAAPTPREPAEEQEAAAEPRDAEADAVPEEAPEEQTEQPEPPAPDRRKTEKSAPWPEEPPAEEPVPRPALPYDLLNRPFDNPVEGAEVMQRVARTCSVRIILMLPVILLSFYMTLAGLLHLPTPWGFTYVAYPYYYMLGFCVLQVLALLLASPSTASGLWRLVHGRPTMDTLVLFSGLCSLAHAMTVIFRPSWGGYLPFTCVSTLTCMLALIQKRQRASALRRSYKAVVMGTVPTGLKIRVEQGEATAVKTPEGAHVEPEALAEPDTTERFSCYYAPLAMVAVLALAAVCSFGRGVPTRFPWALAALSSVVAPASMLLASSSPARHLSKSLLASGSTLVNGADARRLCRAKALVLEDRDLFPAGSVTLTGMKIADDQSPDTVIACAAAIVQEIGGGVARLFSDLARQQYIAPMRAVEVRFFDAGGLSAQVEGRYALLGSADFLVRMGVRVTEGTQLKNSLFLAIDGRFAGIFTLRYGVQPTVYSAFGLLRRGRICPVLALRDFNTGQGFVEDKFDLRVDSTEYPSLGERMKMSAASYARELPTLALLTRDGLLPAAEALLAARRLTKAARIGRICGLCASLLGLLLLYFLCWRGAVASATPYNVALYLAFWALPSCMLVRLASQI